MAPPPPPNWHSLCLSLNSLKRNYVFFPAQRLSSNIAMSSCYVVFSVVCFFKTHLLCSIPLYEYAPLPFSVHDRLGVSGLGLLGIVMLSLVSFVYCNYFVLDRAFPFHSLVPFAGEELLILMTFNIVTFFFMVTASCALLKKSSLPQDVRMFPMIWSRRIYLSCLGL